MPSDRSWDPRSIRQRLLDIFEGIEKTQRFVAGITRDEFLADEVRIAAVERSLMVVCEAAEGIRRIEHERDIPTEESLFTRHPNIAWHKLFGMGNRIRHGYGAIDLDIIWATATSSDLSELLSVLRSELPFI